MPLRSALVAEVSDTPVVVPGTWRNLLAAMRPHQWTKNLFVLAPLLFSKRLIEADAVVHALLAYAAFCLMASALYIFNDIVDAPADRAHPEKRRRPIASGELRLLPAWAACGALLAGSLALAFGLGPAFTGLAGIYLLSVVGYCLAFKRVVILDCLVIAAGFVLRVVGGTTAIQVTPSHWLIVCAFLLALQLAFSKRRHELLTLSESAAQHRRVLGEYTKAYLDQVNTMLLGAVVVCYALYTVAPDTEARFGSGRLIYGAVFVLYALLRYLALVQSGKCGGDPGRLLLRDKPLMLAVLGWAAYNAIVIYFPYFSSLGGRLFY